MVPTLAIVIGRVHSSPELWIGNQKRLPRDGAAGIRNQSVSKWIRDRACQGGIGILHGLCARSIGVQVLVRNSVQVTRNLNIVAVVANVIGIEGPSAQKLTLEAE